MTSVLIIGGNYLPESQRLFNAMATAGALPVAARRTVINTLIDGLIDAGVWTELSRLHVLAAHASAAALIDWKNPTGTGLTVGGSPTFTANRGYTGNGTDGYLGFGANVSALMAQDDCHAGAWQLNETAESSSILAQISGTARFLIQPRTAAGNFATRLMAASTQNVVVASSIGHSLTSRDNSADYDQYRDGALLATPVVASDGLPAVEMTGLRQTTVYSTAEVAILHCGSALTSTQAGDMFDLFDTYLTAVVP